MMEKVFLTLEKKCGQVCSAIEVTKPSTKMKEHCLMSLSAELGIKHANTHPSGIIPTPHNLYQSNVSLSLERHNRKEIKSHYNSSLLYMTNNNKIKFKIGNMKHI